MTAIVALNHVGAAEQAGRDGAMIDIQIDVRVEPAGAAGRQRLARPDFIHGIAVMGIPATNIIALVARRGVRLAASTLLKAANSAGVRSILAALSRSGFSRSR